MRDPGCTARVQRVDYAGILASRRPRRPGVAHPLTNSFAFDLTMIRRRFLQHGLAALTTATLPAISSRAATSDKVVKTRDEWRRTLTAEQFDVLREEGTEAPFTSPLNHEKRKGTFVCVGCAAPLFMSDTKFDSGTGWPSFWAPIPGALATKVDYKLVYPRTEYHCRRCEGHQGHVFDDGPKPTGQRYCNNGIALRFIPA